MIIPGLIIMFVVWGIVSWYSKRKKAQERYEYLKRTDGFRRRTPDNVHREIFQSLIDNWYYGDRSMFPEEYIAYFVDDELYGPRKGKLKGLALQAWMTGRTYEIEIERGYCPIDYPFPHYDNTSDWYHPYRRFVSEKWPERIEEYKKTGRVYEDSRDYRTITNYNDPTKPPVIKQYFGHSAAWIYEVADRQSRPRYYKWYRLESTTKEDAISEAQKRWDETDEYSKQYIDEINLRFAPRTQFGDLPEGDWGETIEIYRKPKEELL